MSGYTVCCAATSTWILLVGELDEEWPVRGVGWYKKLNNKLSYRRKIGVGEMGQKVEPKSRSGRISCISEARE